MEIVNMIINNMKIDNMEIFIPYSGAKKKENYHFYFEPKLAEDNTSVEFNTVGIREEKNKIISITKEENGIRIKINGNI